MDVALVVPSIRPESLDLFLDKWASEFETVGEHLLLVVFETHGNEASRRRWERKLPGAVQAFYHLTQASVEEAWGCDAWILPETNSSCRCFGIWMAARHGAQVIISEDDDAYPDDVAMIAGHLRALGQHATLDWEPILPFGQNGEECLRTRGYPWTIREASPIHLHQGLWTGIPDIDAIVQLAAPRATGHRIAVIRTISRWNFFPMSWMNVSMRREVLPALCPPPSIMDKPTDRFDDTWTGICLKRIMDHLGWAATVGPPYVNHVRATDPFVNLQVEARGMALNEVFWRYVADCPLESDDIFALSEQIGCHLMAHPESEYIRKCGEARMIWIKRWWEALGHD